MYKDTKQRQKIRYLDDNLTLDVELWRETTQFDQVNEGFISSLRMMEKYRNKTDWLMEEPLKMQLNVFSPVNLIFLYFVLGSSCFKIKT